MGVEVPVETVKWIDEVSFCKGLEGSPDVHIANHPVDDSRRIAGVGGRPKPERSEGVGAGPRRFRHVPYKVHGCH
jgi:hypothetical protein